MNKNGIEKAEVLKAIDDYFIHATISKPEVLRLIILYLFP